MITMNECADLVGLAPDELPLCAIPSTRHKSLLKSYLFSLKRGEKALCCLIIGDFWRLMDLGARGAGRGRVPRLAAVSFRPPQSQMHGMSRAAADALGACFGGPHCGARGSIDEL